MKVPGNFHAGAALSVRSDTASAIEEAAEALAENLGQRFRLLLTQAV